jgi:hypothetical protein
LALTKCGGAFCLLQEKCTEAGGRQDGGTALKALTEKASEDPDYPMGQFRLTTSKKATNIIKIKWY